MATSATKSGRNQAAARAASLTVVLALVGLGACTSDSPTVDATSSGTSASSSTTAAGATQLNVMTFNVEYGGEGVDFSSVPAAIEAAGADVVGIE